MGILSLLDEECKFPKGSDKTWLEKLHQNHAKHPNYEAPKKAGVHFIVKHYAGGVNYDVSGFLDKNRDTLQDELMELIYESKNPFISEQLFEEGRKERDDMKADKSGTMKKKAALTVAQKFKDQLAALVQTLTNTIPHYVRCIKPNMQKSSDLWDPEMVLAQLRYSGMLETIRIRRSGYPLRYLVKDFWGRYKCIVPSIAPVKDMRVNCQALLKQVKLAADEWQLGQTKVFLRESQRPLLEDQRNVAVLKIVTKLQKVTRGWLVRKKYTKMRKAALRLESAIRGYYAKQVMIKKKKAIILTQSLERRRKLRTAYVKLKSSTLAVQLRILKNFAYLEYMNLLALKAARLEAERLEKERIAQERALLDAVERKRLEEEDRIKEDAEQAEKQKQREELEKLRMDLIEKEKIEEKKRKIEAVAAEEKQGLQELGLLGELNDLEDLLKKDLALGPADLPAPVDAIDDLDLLDKMASPEFFGNIEIPKNVVSQLDQLAGIKPPEQMNFDFLDLPPPPSDLPQVPGELPPPPSDLPPPPDSGLPPPIKKPPKLYGTLLCNTNPTRDPPQIILPEEVNNFSFKSFATNNFRDQKKKTTAEIYSWSKVQQLSHADR